MESAKNEQPPSDAAVRRVSGQNGASTGSHLAPTSGEQARTRDADTDSSDSLCASAHSEDGAGPSDAETRTATVGEESVAEVKLPYHIALKLDSSLPSRDRYLYGRMGRVPAKDLLSPTEVRHIESTGRSTSELASKEHFREMNYLFKKVVSAHTSAWKIYGNKVDAEQLKIPDYYNVIRKPMYLKKVEKKLQRALEGREKGYTNVGKVVADIRLALRNAELYNGPMIEVVKTCGAAMHIVLMKEWAERLLKWGAKEGRDAFPLPDEELVTASHLALYHRSMRTALVGPGAPLWPDGPVIGCSRCRRSPRGCRFCLENVLDRCKAESRAIPHGVYDLANRFLELRLKMESLRMPVAPREQGTGGAARGPSTAQRAPDRGAPGQREDGSQSGSGKKREAGAGKKRGAEEALGKAPPSGQAKAPKKQGDGVAGPTSRGAPGEGAGTRGAVEAPETPRKDVTGEKSAELPDSPGVDRAREEAMEDALEEMEDETGKAMDSLEGALAGVQKTFKRKMREVLRDARREVRTWKRQVKRLKEMRDDLQRRVRELEGEVQRLGGGGASDGGRSV